MIRKEIALKEGHFNWVMEPTGGIARSNEMIAKNLPDETEGSFKKCNDGKDHYLWDCSFMQAKKFWDSRRSMQIDIRIWSQEGRGEIKPHTFLLKKSTAGAIKKQIAKIQCRDKATKL